MNSFLLSQSIIILVPEKGADICDCKLEAALISLKQQHAVVFVFNGITYETSPILIMDSVREKII